MRNKKAAAYLCTYLLLLMTAGCGNADADLDVPTVDVVDLNDVNDANAEDDNVQQSDSIQSQADDAQSQPDAGPSQADDAQSQPDDTQSQPDAGPSQADDTQSQPDASLSQPDDAQPQSDLQLDGTIESIGNSSVTINKTFHPSANESVSYAVDKVLVTVYFSEETEFEIWTVKNGGVNGDADTEKQTGAFSDLKLDASIKMTGSYDGDDFYATHVIIYNFV